MSRAVFLCELPPPFGGVTVKNKLLLDQVFTGDYEVSIVDFGRVKRNLIHAIPVFLSMVSAFLRHDVIIYGFGSHKRQKVALRIQSIFGGKKSLSKTINIVMGGNYQQYLEKDEVLTGLLKRIKINLVETRGMQQDFIKLGLERTEVFPNARTRDAEREPADHQGILKCVFFSKICEDKGVDYIISEFKQMKSDQVSLCFYGHVDENIRGAFESFVQSHENVTYAGVFDATKEDVYKELNQYDVLLLPTKWKGEGVPGVLVEAKMAGIASIVSDCNYNAEIVRDGIEGIVLKSLTAGELSSELLNLSSDSVLLKRLKQSSFDSRKRYAIDSYLEMLRNLIAQ